MQITSFLQEKAKEAVSVFKESGLNNIAIPGANGFFITCDKAKDEVVYVGEIKVDGIDYFIYNMNPVA